MDILSEMWREMTARPNGPFAFRFYLQPLMAAFFAVRDGLNDARAGRPPYLATLFREKGRRKELVRDAWASIGRVFVLAIGIDVLYQVTVLHRVRPIQGLVIAVALAIVPYALLRGPVNRIAKRIFAAPRDREAPSAHSRQPR